MTDISKSTFTLTESNTAQFDKRFREQICARAGEVGASIIRDEPIVYPKPSRNDMEINEATGKPFTDKRLIDERIVTYDKWSLSHLDICNWWQYDQQSDQFPTPVKSDPCPTPSPTSSPGFIYHPDYLELPLLHGNTAYLKRLEVYDRVKESLCAKCNLVLTDLLQTVTGTALDATTSHPDYGMYTSAVAASSFNAALFFYRSVKGAMLRSHTAHRVADVQALFRLAQLPGEATASYGLRVLEGFTKFRDNFGITHVVDGRQIVSVDIQNLEAIQFLAGLSESPSHMHSLYFLQSSQPDCLFKSAAVVKSKVIDDELNCAGFTAMTEPGAFRATATAPRYKIHSQPGSPPSVCKRCASLSIAGSPSHLFEKCPFNPSYTGYVGLPTHLAARAKEDAARLAAGRPKLPEMKKPAAFAATVPAAPPAAAPAAAPAAPPKTPLPTEVTAEWQAQYHAYMAQMGSF